MGSIIATVLKWTGLSQGAMELIALGVVASGVAGVAAYEHHKIYTEGVAAQQKADTKASAKVIAAANAQTAKLQDEATTAERNYEKTQAAIAALPAAGPVRLCINPDNSSRDVPKITSTVPGNAGAGSSASSLQPVPQGDTGSRTGTTGPDIGPLLGALAASADQVSATLT